MQVLNPETQTSVLGEAILIDSIIKMHQPSVNIQKLDVENGTVHFVGTAPDKEQAVKNL